MNLSKSIENFSSNELRVGVTSGVAAGLVAAAITSTVNALYHPLNLAGYARFAFLAIASYLAVAGLRYRFWRGLLERVLPSCIVIALFGSILFTTVRLLPGVIAGWTSELRLEVSLTEYLLAELDASLSVVFVLTFVTVPITALFQYAGHIVRAARSWHNPGSLSVLDEKK